MTPEPRKKVAALIWLAIDPRTGEPEALAALLAIRRLNVSLDELKLALGNAANRETVVERAPEFLDPIFPFGRHKGKRVSEIPTAYLMWVLDNTSVTGTLATQIELAIAGAKGKAAA
jgi:uncharacterized protein (DUF3820 family)